MISLIRLLKEATEIPRAKTDQLFHALGLDKTKVDPEQFFMGINVELEHINITHGDLKKTALLVLAHLKEQPDYYTRLQKVEYASDMADDDLPPVTGQMSS